MDIRTGLNNANSIYIADGVDGSKRIEFYDRLSGQRAHIELSKDEYNLLKEKLFLKEV